MKTRYGATVLATALVAGLLTACADSSTAPSVAVIGAPNQAVVVTSTRPTGLLDGEVEVCKTLATGAPTPGFNFQFDVAVNGGAPTTVNLAAGSCATIYQSTADGTQLDQVVVTEVVPPTDWFVSAVDILRYIPAGYTPPVGDQASTNVGTRQASVSINNDMGARITFENDFTAEGCTYTQGYWKTHSSYGPAGPEDEGWDNVGGPDAAFFGSGLSWIELWNVAPGKAGDFGLTKVYVQLAHQYMAAKLNILNGATPTSAVSAAITGAEAYFGGGPFNSTWAGTLAAFNEGDIGPGHCSDEV